MEFTNSKISNYILYSHKNQEKLFKSLINESCNAVLLESFDDKLLMGDHTTGNLYLADYSFDGKNLKLENFEPVNIIKDENELTSAINEYFEDEVGDIAKLVEAYDNSACSENNELQESIREALAGKNNDKPDFTQLVGINEEVSELKEMNFFKVYSERLEEAPLSVINMIDWNKPLNVSLIDEDTNLEFFIGNKEKAEKLIKSKEFKNTFAEAIEDMLNGDNSIMENLFADNKSLLLLSEQELKEFVGMSVIGNKELMENRKEITASIMNIINESEELSETKALLEEDEAVEDENAKGKEELSVNEKDIEALQNALDKALENITDEKLVNKINDLKDALDNSKDSESTDVSTVKECVAILSM